MTRLTNHIREQIVKAAIAKSGLLDAAKAIDAKYLDWVERCRIEELGGVENAARYDSINRQAQELCLQLPENLRGGADVARLGTNIYFNIGGARFRQDFTAGQEEGRVSSARLTLAADHPLALEWTALEAERGANKQAISSAKHQVGA